MHVIWEALQQKSYIFADEYELLKYIIAWRRMMQTDAMHNERRWNNANESCASVWPYLLYVCNPDILYETPIYYNPDILYVCNPDILTAQVVLPHHGERASSYCVHHRADAAGTAGTAIMLTTTITTRV
jgi:hypothetical protein